MEFLAFWQWFYFLYFLGLNAGYLLLNIISIFHLSKYMQEMRISALPKIYFGFELPVSIIVPAYNEEVTIESTVKALLQLSYPEYEVIIVNDGSKDNTLNVLIEKFSLIPFPEAYRIRLPVKPVRTIYRSTKYPGIRVIDKENGGKSDALNSAINISRFPLFCCIDADSMPQRDSLQKVVRPFLEDPNVIASGGTIRLANGSEFRDGFLVKVGLPKNPLALMQIVEYLRAFLFGRMGWAPLNALLIISGAFSLFNKEVVIAAGGYRVDTIGEDMELVVRLHRHFRMSGRPYKITFVPDPICWTEAPEDLTTLKNQRIRWQIGLSESLTKNMGLFLHPKAGTAGWIAFPFMVLFEWLGPLIEIAGYVFVLFGFLFGIISHQVFIAFLLLAIGFSLMISVTALMLEEITFHLYSKPKHLLLLFMAVLFENLGYRQVIACWRLTGLMRWVLSRKGHWGSMSRTANWQQKA